MQFFSISPYFICMAIMLVVARANAGDGKLACRRSNSPLEYQRREPGRC